MDTHTLTKTHAGGTKLIFSYRNFQDGKMLLAVSLLGRLVLGDVDWVCVHGWIMEQNINAVSGADIVFYRGKFD